MPTITEWSLFCAAFCVAAFGSLALVLKSSKALSWRLIIGSVIYSGGLGSSFALTIGRTYLGGDKSPILIICYAVLVGCGIINQDAIREIYRRVLLAMLPKNGNDPKSKSSNDSADSSKNP